MEIFPAIDLLNGEAVRLKHGDYNKVTVYSNEPAKTAANFKKSGARNLHIVDLDGARDGKPANYDVISDIIKTCGLITEVGGGIRDEERIRQYLNLGAERVILGTMALDRAFLSKMLVKFGYHITVGVDAKNGKTAVRGWLEVCDVDSVQFCRDLAGLGVKNIIYTDIAKDGEQSGTNLDIYRRLSSEVQCNVIASGGISYEDEITELNNIGTFGAVLGKAIYTGALDLERAIKIADGKEKAVQR
ncbi:MAG: 1-(5-phosphoribosyl)-5-[(5-phosphoribosylamino)methylideneamino]imidazole-4-carboxamide isomerase [Hydrogenoanaerobacterium sp.]